jgi:hypothetical protein
MSSSPGLLPIVPEVGPADGIALRKMGRAGLERAYSPKAWLAMQHGLRVQNTYRGFAHSGLVSYYVQTPGELPQVLICSGGFNGSMPH